MSTPDDIAQRTLDNHAIRDHWKRNGEQIRDLLVEAVEMDRAERGLVVQPKPLGENMMLGLRESAARIDFEGGTGELDHSFGFGGLTLSLTVRCCDDHLSETLDLRPMVQEWVARVRGDVLGRHGTSRDVTPGEEINQ